MREIDATKKEIADYCEQVYQDETLTKKQVTDRLGAFIRRHLAKIGVVRHTRLAGGRQETDYELKGSDGLVHGVSHHLRWWLDAIMALEMKHHLVDVHIEKAAKYLEEYIPDLRKQLDPELPIKTLRDRLTVMIKNESRKVVRDILSDIRIEHHAYYLLQPVYEWSRKLATANDAKNLNRKVSSQIKVNPQFAVNSAGAMLTENLAKGERAEKYELALALAIATGRRRTEIFKSAKFWFTETTPDEHVMFSGQLKTHDRELFDDVKPYPIPCLVDRQLVVDGLKLLRKLQRTDALRYRDARGNMVEAVSPLDEGRDDLYHNRAVSEYYNHSSQAAIRKLFNNPHLEFRHTRDMYSRIGYERFKKPGEAESVYRTRVYGHASGGSGGTDSQKHYEKFELDHRVKTATFQKDGERKTKGANKGLVAALTALDKEIASYLRSPNMALIHAWVKEQLSLGLDPETISASYIRRYLLVDGKVLNLNTCRVYLDEKVRWAELVAKHPFEPADPEAADDEGQAEEAEAIADNKPKVLAFAIDGGWDVIIELGGHVRHRQAIQGGSKLEAMRQAWEAWQAPEQPQAPRLPAAMPKPRVSKRNGGWLVQVFHGGTEVVGIWQKGSQGDAIRSAQRAYQDELDKQQ